MESVAETKIFDKDASAPPPRILVVDDDSMIRDMLKEILSSEGYEVDLSEGSGDALEKLIDYRYNLLLIDANLPGISGFELLKYCKKHHPIMEIIMITGNPELDDAISSVKDGAFDYISKPFSVRKLVARISDALKHQKENLMKSLSITKTAMGVDGKVEPLPGYKVIKTLGTGTMGVVLLVEKEGRQYALKILRRDNDEASQELRVKRFLREAKILSEIIHPNIVKVYESGFPKSGGAPHILMEYVPGKSLTHYIKENILDMEKKLAIIGQIATALSVVHKYGILHRDIKPSNILVNNEFVAKLTDFGIAKVTDSSLTMTNEVLGSPAYMPPENFKINKTLDCRSDIFSLGVLAYELVTGKKPFHGETVAEMMTAIQKARPVEPKKLVPDLPPKIQAIIGKMLHKNPEDRFQTADEIAEWLKNSDQSEKEPDTKPKSIIRNILGGGKIWQ